jgi:uncharacterized protein YpuA (DUF1002 family)
MERAYEDIKWPKEFPLSENEGVNKVAMLLAREIWKDILDKLPTTNADNIDRVVKNAYNNIKDNLIEDTIYNIGNAVIKVMKQQGTMK